MAFITLTPENVMSEHLCCAIADKKHQTGVNDKRNWLAERIKEGHVFRKLDAQGKVFIDTINATGWQSVSKKDTSSANWMRREKCSLIR